MRIGIAPLTVALLVMTSRLAGSASAAELFGFAYLVMATFTMSRRRALTAPDRVRS